MTVSERFTEVARPVARVDLSLASTAESSAWVAADEFNRMVAVIMVGTIVATGVFNAKLEQATDVAGAGAKDITGKAITALADSDDDVIMAIELRMDELDVTGGFNFVRLTLTPSVANSTHGGILFGLEPRHMAVAITDWEEVVD